MDKKSGLKKTEPGLVCRRIHRMFRTQKQKRAEAVWPQIESPNELEFTEFTLTDRPNSKGKGQDQRTIFAFSDGWNSETNNTELRISDERSGKMEKIITAIRAGPGTGA